MSTACINVVAFGSRHVAVGRFVRTGAALQLRCLETAPLTATPTGGVEWLEESAQLLASLARRGGLAGPVRVVPPAQYTLNKYLRTPQVSEAKQRRILRFEAIQAVTCDFSEVVWDAVRAGDTGGQRGWLMVAARRAALESLCAAVASAGLEPELIVPEGLATLACLRADDVAKGRRLVLHLSASIATMLHLDGDRFTCRSVDLGHDSEPNATNGSDSSCRFAAQADRLAGEIKRAVLHYELQAGMGRPESILLGGAGPELPAWVALLGARLGLPILPWQPAARAQGTARDEILPGWAVHLYGAALAPATGSLHLDILPLGWRRRAAVRSSGPWLLGAALLVLSAMVGMNLHYRHLGGLAAARTITLERALAPVEARMERLRAKQARLEALHARIEQLQSLEQHRRAWLDILDDLQLRLARVNSAWIDRLRPLPSEGNSPRRIAVAGRLWSGPDNLAMVKPDLRVRQLFAELLASPHVAAIEQEHFDGGGTAQLKFDLILVMKPLANP